VQCIISDSATHNAVVGTDNYFEHYFEADFSAFTAVLLDTDNCLLVK